MNLKHLEYFIKVAELGSISKAANMFYLKPSNLSSCMKKLEEDFGAVLFIRNTKGVILTSEGRDVLEWAKNVLSSRQELLLKFQAQNHSLNNIDNSINLFVGSTINQNITNSIRAAAGFSDNYPQCSMKLCESNTHGVIRQVLEHKQSIGISIFNSKMIAELQETPELNFLPIRKVKLLAFVAKNSAYAKEYNSMSLKTLMSLPIIMYAPIPETEPLIEEILNGYAKLNIASQVSNAMFFNSLLKTGKYVALGVGDLSNGGMEGCKSIPIRDKFDLVLGMIYKNAEQDNPLIQSYVKQFAKKQSEPS